jgi:deazaflavin-dependent oxidoreductase (nitroreductase family)
MGFGNTFAMGVLRSPLHGMMSRSLLILTYEGRRSGATYSLPLQYVEDGDTLAIWAGNASEKTWWRNFTTPALVEVQLRGEEVPAKARLVADPERRARLLRSYVDRYPNTTPTGRPKFFGERWDPTDEELAAAAESIVMVEVQPT